MSLKSNILTFFFHKTPTDSVKLQVLHTLFKTSQISSLNFLVLIINLTLVEICVYSFRFISYNIYHLS